MKYAITRPDSSQLPRKYSKKLKKVNPPQDKMINVLAHDLKAPIKSMIGLAQLLEMEGNLQENLQAKNYVALIKKTGNSSIRLIEELLRIAELEDEDFQLDKKDTNLVKLICTVLEVHKTIAGMKNISITFDQDPGDYTLSLDRVKFKQVLDNLLSNAIKFTLPQGQIAVSLKRDGENVIIKIADTGIGIPADKQPLLFDKFTKIRRRGTDGENSTGLGMSIIKQILDLHKASISFTSEEYLGTEFTISFPAENN